MVVLLAHQIDLVSVPSFSGYRSKPMSGKLGNPSISLHFRLRAGHLSTGFATDLCEGAR